MKNLTGRMSGLRPELVGSVVDVMYLLNVSMRTVGSCALLGS